MTDANAAPPPTDITALLNQALMQQAIADSAAHTADLEAEKLKPLIAKLELAMQLQHMTGVTSTLGSADISYRTVYQAADWLAVYAHIKDTGHFDLLEKRLLQTAMRDRDSNGELPPGVKRVTLPKLKLTAR